ncbi:UNVERIFIED_CONTAM: hypothetical protein K2H54_053595 [Gekko kuhli]
MEVVQYRSLEKGNACLQEWICEELAQGEVWQRQYEALLQHQTRLSASLQAKSICVEWQNGLGMVGMTWRVRASGKGRRLSLAYTGLVGRRGRKLLTLPAADSLLQPQALEKKSRARQKELEEIQEALQECWRRGASASCTSTSK